MNGERSIPLGVCVLPAPPPNAARTVSYPDYIHEILQHAGLCYATVDVDELATALPRLRLLVTVGDFPLNEGLGTQLRAWLAAGGCWIGVGGVCGLGDLFGVIPEAPAYSSFGGGGGALGEGYLRPQAAHRLFDHLAIPLHFFDGVPVQPQDARVLATVLDAHQRETARAALTEKEIGQGRCLLIAPDLPGTVVRIQQGVGVTRDGVSAPDGTAPVNDSVLKSGDGGVLDWIFDRQPVPDTPGLQAFLQPIADQWRELLLRAIFHCAQTAGVRLPLLWLYPRNLPAIAHLSHDSDQNEPQKAERLLEVTAEAGVPATWCVILPGYAPALMQRIHNAGYELAMHYDSMSEGCPWSAELFHEQWRELVDLFDGAEPVANKNHYLRWEGDVEFFRWCVAHGIQLDQSKGASKTGEAGFNFGTCHPYFPVDFAGHLLDVLELPTPTQDLVVFAPPTIFAPLLEAVLRSHGVLHLLFHPAHIQTEGVADALLRAVKEAKVRGLEWWTAAYINRWERARRQARWSNFSDDGSLRVTLHVDAGLEDATVLWLGDAAGAASVDGQVVASAAVIRWGFTFQALVFDAGQGSATQLELRRRTE